jgi:hypothetical protein
VHWVYKGKRGNNNYGGNMIEKGSKGIDFLWPPEYF